VTVTTLDAVFSSFAFTVIGELVGISQQMLHSRTALSHILQSLMLLNQRILQRHGILIQNARRLDTEVINYGGGFGT